MQMSDDFFKDAESTHYRWADVTSSDDDPLVRWCSLLASYNNNKRDLVEVELGAQGLLSSCFGLSEAALQPSFVCLHYTSVLLQHGNARNWKLSIDLLLVPVDRTGQVDGLDEWLDLDKWIRARENGHKKWLIVGSTAHLGVLAPPFGQRCTISLYNLPPKDWPTFAPLSTRTIHHNRKWSHLTDPKWVSSPRWSLPNSLLPLSAVQILSSEALSSSLPVPVFVCLCSASSSHHHLFCSAVPRFWWSVGSELSPPSAPISSGHQLVPEITNLKITPSARATASSPAPPSPPLFCCRSPESQNLDTSLLRKRQ